MSTRIPLSLLRDLKCRHCRNFLSCGPVYVTPDCGLLCGRCKALAKPNFRNYVFEELAGTFKFPCLNWDKHCPQEGAWNTLKEHELDCPYGGSCKLLCISPTALFSSKRILPNEDNLLYIEVPDACLNLVCCKNCGKYLSCSPVHINVVGSNICHRCYLSNGVPPQTLRNLAYEKIASIFRFPCVFRAKGCPIKFKFGRDSSNHEVVCHYRDVQITSIPPTPEADMKYLKPEFENDGSGYRPSYGTSSMASRSFNRDSPVFELPRVSSLLKKQELAERANLNKQRIWNRQNVVEQSRRTNDDQVFRTENDTRHLIACDCGDKECNGVCSDRERSTDKEKGIIPTHTGHVYATLTKSSILFAPPQIQPNKDPSNGMKVTREFQDKLRRNASNASENKNIHPKDIRNSYSFEKTFSPKNDHIDASNNASDYLDFPGLNKNQLKELEKFDGNISPDVKEYTKYNPQNNIQRNDSMTIGNADLIAELKVRNERRKMEPSQENHQNNIKRNDSKKTGNDLIAELKWRNEQRKIRASEKELTQIDVH